MVNPILNYPILFTINNISKYLNFKIGYFYCDSLAASYVLGMKVSFNHSFCCRFCLCRKENFKNCYNENDIQL